MAVANPARTARNKTKCEYCGRWNNAAREMCAGCGAALEHAEVNDMNPFALATDFFNPSGKDVQRPDPIQHAVTIWK